MTVDVVLAIFSQALFLGMVFLVRWSPLWVPVVLLIIFFKLWTRYVRAEAMAKTDYTLLQIRLPREIQKSPLAMELVLNALHQTGGEGTFIKKYWEGGVRAWFSLEIVSIEGDIGFFIWTRDALKKTVETQIYAQYPDAEVVEVPDYATRVHYDEKLSLWGAEFELTKEDPYPIKTYVDYGLEKDPKEEFKIDPMTAVIEYLGSLGKGEQAWIQILVRAHKKEDKPKGKLFSFKKTDRWKDDAKEEIEKIVKDATLKTGDEKVPTVLNLTKGQQETIAALERSIAKLPFDVGIRALYLADEEHFNKANIGGLAGSFKQYGSHGLNGFKPTRATDFDYPWQDFRGMRLATLKRIIFDAYRRRSYFHPPYKRPHFILNAEELATIYHFPGGVAQTPTFKRIESRKAEPPTDLPV